MRSQDHCLRIRCGRSFVVIVYFLTMKRTYVWTSGIMVWAVAALGGCAFVSKPKANLPARPTATWVLKHGVWIPVVQPGNTSPAGQVATMIKELHGNQPYRVIHQSKKFLKHHKTDPLVPQVLLLQGDAYNMVGRKYRALFPYEDLLDNFPNSPLYGPCLEREYNIACAFLAGYKRNLLGMRIIPVTGDAIRLLRRIQDRQRGSPLAELAGIHVADYYYKQGEFGTALNSYRNFVRRYPYSQFVVKADIREAQCMLGTFKGVRFDLTPLRNAEAKLDSIILHHPRLAEKYQAKALEERIYQVEGKKELLVARFYLRFGDPGSAKFYFHRVINGWPDTIWAVRAKQELANHFGAGAG
jgi:outer membrane protein assembly factor BamD (BamD/ComL family)